MHQSNIGVTKDQRTAMTSEEWPEKSKESSASKYRRGEKELKTERKKPRFV